MRLRRGSAPSRPTRRAADSSRPPAITPGARGLLELRLTEAGLTVEHTGEFRYVGTVRGLLAFVPADTEPVVYLRPDEVVAFVATS